jgi:hypothetical protein
MRSTSVLFPVPGAPVMPMQYEFPVCGKSWRIKFSASPVRFSISVMARETARTSPARTCSTHWLIVMEGVEATGIGALP